MNTKTTLFLILLCSVALVSTLEFSGKLDQNPHIKMLFLQMQTNMKQSGDGTVGFATVVAIIQRLIESSNKKIAQYEGLIANQTENCDLSMLTLNKRLNSTGRMIVNATKRISSLNNTLSRSAVSLEKTKKHIAYLDKAIDKANMDYKTYNETKITTIRTLNNAITATTDLMTIATYIATVNSFKDEGDLSSKSDYKNYLDKVGYLKNNTQKFIHIAKFYSFDNFTEAITDAIEALDIKVETLGEQKQIFINGKISSMRQIFEIVLKSANRGQARDLLFQTKISNLNDLLSSRIQLRKNYIQRMEKIQKSMTNYENAREKIAESYASLEKLIVTTKEWCKAEKANFATLKISFEEDRDLYTDIKKYFSNNFMTITDKMSGVVKKEIVTKSSEFVTSSNVTSTKIISSIVSSSSTTSKISSEKLSQIVKEINSDATKEKVVKVATTMARQIVKKPTAPENKVAQKPAEARILSNKPTVPENKNAPKLTPRTTLGGQKPATGPSDKVAPKHKPNVLGHKFKTARKVHTNFLTHIRVVSTGKCLTNNQTSGSVFSFAPCEAKDFRQKFRMVKSHGVNDYYIMTASGTYAMNLTDSNTRDGSKFRTMFLKRSPSQQFTIEKVGNYFKILQKEAQKCLTTQYNFDCVIYKCFDNDDAQLFSLELDKASPVQF